jgi:alanyl-tRNA synthetase
MTSREAREQFLSYFESKNHTRKASSSLVPDNDPTVLLTTAGMQQFIPYFLGQAEAPFQRYTTSQKCFRTPDIDEVGDETHDTFFEMLGNFSIGDYFKEDAIKFGYELLTEKFGLDPKRFAITIFKGDEKVARDSEAADIWMSLGIPKNRIYEFGRGDNFWGPPGQEGPCGPCSEVHYYFGEGEIPEDSGPNGEDDRFMELWNLVFMQYFQDAEGNLTPLKKQNVDTGMGLERLMRVLHHKETGETVSIFESDCFSPMVKKVSELSGKQYDLNILPFRIIADHIRGATFLIANDVAPHKEGRGYVLRRVLRRAIEAAKFQLGMKLGDLPKIAEVVIENFKEMYPELSEKREHILAVIRDEEQKYSETLEKGKHEVEKRLARMTPQEFMTPQNLYDLKETHGLTPQASLTSAVTLTEDHAKIAEFEKAYEALDEKTMQKLFEEKQEISRRGMKDKFDRAGGGQGPERATSHTATHLLHAAVRKVLSEDATQSGSQLGDGEFRFDFKWPTKLTDEQRKQVEDLVNEQIKKNLTVEEHKMTIEEAKKLGAIALFEHKYGETVRVFLMGKDGDYFSKEVCGGPHVVHTKDIQFFKITKEKSSSAGVRRIKAQVGKTPENAELHL